jgi:L-malate glycosyltransferase
MRARSILYVCDFNAHGGTQTHLLHLFQSIDRRVCRPSLATLNLEAGLASRLRELDIDVTNLGLRGALRPATWRRIAALASRCRETGVDLVHGYLFQGNLIAAAVSILGGVPCITSVRNVDDWKRARHRIASGAAHRRARRVLFNSNAVRERTVDRERIPPDRTVVIYNGVADLGRASREAAALENPPEGGAPLIVCVASLREKKGHAHLLEAFRIVRDRVPSARLLLAGDGPLRSALERRAAAAGLSGAVQFLGHRHDVADLLGRSDLFVLSSLEEGMPNALLEAMSAGLPAVVTDVGGSAEVVVEGETGSLVPPARPEAMAERMTALLLDEDLRRRQSRAARLRYQALFTLDRMIAAYHDLYADVLGGSEAS